MDHFRQIYNQKAAEYQRMIAAEGIDGNLPAEFFFGPELSERTCENGWARVPEWTGIWWRPA